MGTRVTLQEETKTVIALAPIVHTATQNGAAVDRKGFNDVLFAIQCGVLNADTSVTVTLEESDASGSGYAAVAGFSQAIGGADDGLRFEMFVDARPRKQFLRLVFTGTSTSALLAALAVMKSSHVNPQS